MAKKTAAPKSAAKASPVLIETNAAAAPKALSKAKSASKEASKAAARSVSRAAPKRGVKLAPQARIQVGERDLPPNPPTAPSKELHVFANPSSSRDYVIQFQIPEFTCNCPLTGQPDFAHFTIDMICDELCIELKSLKMYMWSYRNEGSFHEKVTNTILDDIVEATRPRFVRITAKWYVRGGIYTNVVVEHRKRGWTPAPRIELPAVGAIGMATGLI